MSSDPLAGYERHRKRLISPVNQLTSVTDVTWAERTLPEVLWLTADWDAGGGDVVAALDILQRHAAPVAPGGAVIDGRISNFALIVPERRPAARADWRREAPWASPMALRRALSFFPECPAAWLFEPVPPSDDGEREAALEFLRRAIVLLIDGHGAPATAVRAFILKRLSDLGAASGIDETFALGPSAVRASWSALLAAHDLKPGHSDAGAWSAHFWEIARGLAPCDLGDLGEPADIGHDARGELDARSHQVSLAAAQTAGDALRVHQTATVPNPPLSWQDTTVLLGMASRAYRLFVLLLQQPGMWNNGSFSFLLRPLIEARIAITWLGEQDAAAFEAYREHGRGTALMLRSRIEQSAAVDGVGLDDKTRALLDEQTRRDGSERTWLAQDVNLGSWGPSVRSMAKEVDLDEVYGIEFAGSSSSVHGEWTTVRDMEGELCIEPLHGHHHLAAFDPPRQPVELQIPRHALHHVVEACEAAFLGCGFESVRSLFEPLEAAVSQLALVG